MPSRRIVLSDDEEEDEILPSSAPETRKASTQAQTQTQTQVKEFMTPSGSPERKRKTRSSSGNARSSKEKTRKAMNQMASGMGQGLAGLDADSSEESESAFIDDDDESYGDYDDHQEEEDERNVKHSASSSSKKKKKVAQFVIGLPANPPRSTNKPARRDDTYVSDAESYESEDMNEFILSKEEEEEEEEDRIRKESKARRKAKKERKRKKDMKRAAAAAMFDESVRKGGKSSAKKSPGKKRIIVLEDEDEDEDEDAIQQPSKSSKRQKVVSAESSEDEEKEQEAGSVSSSDEEEDDDGGEEEEEEALDGPELYWQVDKMAAEEHELDHTMSMRQNFDEGEAVQVYIEYLCHCHMKPQFADKVLKSPREPTHARYLAAAKHVEDRICTVRESLVGSGAWSGKGKDFTWELQRRPFYTTDASSVDRLRESVEGAGADYGICAACARQNKIAPNIVFLFGAEYDARAVWNRKQWHLEMPEGVFLHERQKEKRRGGDAEEEEEKEKDGDEDEDEEDDDGDEGEDEEEGYSDVEDAPHACQWWLRKWPGRLTAGKETSWELSGHCRGRTQLYHALLHYKLRLLLKVRDKLERLYGNITELVSNREFCKGEADRFENLLDIATSKFGGKGMEDAAVRRIAGVWEDGRGAPSPEAAANRASERRRSSMSMLQWLSQTNKKGGDGGAAAKRDDNDDDFEGG